MALDVTSNRWYFNKAKFRDAKQRTSNPETATSLPQPVDVDHGWLNTPELTGVTFQPEIQMIKVYGFDKLKFKCRNYFL